MDIKTLLLFGGLGSGALGAGALAFDPELINTAAKPLIDFIATSINSVAESQGVIELKIALQKAISSVKGLLSKG